MRSTIASHSSFAAFGIFWGTWGAALPALRDASSVGGGALGTALLFVGLAGLPAMLLTGRAVDRYGARIAGPLLVALAVAGVLIAVLARDLPTLVVGMALVGAASGAADVAGNALAGLAEQRSGGRVITVSHGVFSSAVVVGSLGTGALRAAGADVGTVFAVAGALMTVAGAVAFRLGDGPQAASPAGQGRRRHGLRLVLPFVAVGLVGALGFAAENAHQSWSAIILGDELGAGVGVTALAPAVFASFAALTRFGVGFSTRIPTGVLLVGGAVTAVLGTLLVSAGQTVPVVLGGLALAAIGTSVLYPTLLSRATRDVPADQRGRATSAVATTSYMGFVLGPVYVGLLSDAVGLRGAMVGVALLVVAFALLAPAVTRDREHTVEPEPTAERVPATR
jgi:predicted MFS family arabinose efflux permease